jgi:hypothetical protein
MAGMIESYGRRVVCDILRFYGQFMEWNSADILRALRPSAAKWPRSPIELFTGLTALAFCASFSSCGGGSAGGGVGAGIATAPTVCNPLSFGAVGDGMNDNTDAIQSAAQPITPTTPHVHDITIRDLVATGATGQSYIRGLPESCIRNVTL